ncbi:hypothetical protein, partial [Streptomyces sp. NPDC059009]|uniref:hypothetical protein n=1 Tax=Streptomyces sp. NPDC059009 TaxID=3346694 RepID=UPI00369053C9
MEPSLAVDYKPGDRKTVVYCHAGCDIRDVVAAVGLELSDLYDDPMPEDRKTQWQVIPRARSGRGVKSGASKKVTQKKDPKPAKAACTGRYAETDRYPYPHADGVLAG